MNNKLYSGIYIMRDYDNQETLVDVKVCEKTIKFELIGEKPEFTYGDMDEFLYNNKKRIINKIKSGHAITIWSETSFTLYPFQSGNPYLFKLKKVESDE